MVNSIKGFWNVDKNTAYSFIIVNQFHFKIDCEFNNCLLGEKIFPEAKLVLKYNFVLFQEMI